MKPGDTESEWKCLDCEFVCGNRTEMAFHQNHQHNRLFRPEEQGNIVSQMGHFLYFVKIIEYCYGYVWETRSTKLDPNEEKLPTGNLDKES